MSTVKTERVLVVPTTQFHAIGHFQGFCPDANKYVQPLLNSKEISYRPRDEMEQDPSFKQLIPYVIFQYQAEDKNKTQVFQYTRGKGQGESRLHAKLSIGIGGHISSDDTSQDQGSGADGPYFAGMQRELDEEVRIDTAYDQQCVGLINDDETEVGKVHLGVVHLYTVAEPLVFANEEEIVDAGFRTVEQLREELPRMETWSRYCFEALFGEG